MISHTKETGAESKRVRVSPRSPMAFLSISSECNDDQALKNIFECTYSQNPPNSANENPIDLTGIIDLMNYNCAVSCRLRIDLPVHVEFHTETLCPISVVCQAITFLLNSISIFCSSKFHEQQLAWNSWFCNTNKLFVNIAIFETGEKIIVEIQSETTEYKKNVQDFRDLLDKVLSDEYTAFEIYNLVKKNTTDLREDFNFADDPNVLQDRDIRRAVKKVIRDISHGDAAVFYSAITTLNKLAVNSRNRDILVSTLDPVVVKLLELLQIKTSTASVVNASQSDEKSCKDCMHQDLIDNMFGAFSELLTWLIETNYLLEKIMQYPGLLSALVSYSSDTSRSLSITRRNCLYIVAALKL